MGWQQRISSINIQIAIIGTLFVGAIVAVVIPGYLSHVPTQNSIRTSSQKLDTSIALLSTQIQENPKNPELYIDLSHAYLQKVRETADSAYYTKIQDLMTRAETIDPTNPNIPATNASVELGRHHFKEAKQYAEQALARDSHNNIYYGLLGDAEIELGHYSEAVDAFQKMSDLRPDYSSYIRIAYIRELYGDIPRAKESLQLAISSGSSFKENIAFAYVELGKLTMRTNLPEASVYFMDALRLVPDYPPALEGLGKVALFNGDSAHAEEYFLKAYNTLSIVQYATDVGDLYLQQGKKDASSQYITLAKAAFAQSEKSGVDTDLEQSLFLSDHDIDLSEALIRAKRAYTVRPSTYAADYLGWAYYKNGQFAQASQYEKEALRLGDTDSLILFHQGMIALKNGNTSKAKTYLAKSLQLNPYFSILQSRVGSDTLKNMSL